jgi:DNA-binding MarR family transcriptional regulator
MARFEEFERPLMAIHATEFTHLELTMAQAKLLYVVATAQGSAMSEIAQRLGVTLSTASGAVEKLVEMGFLARSADPVDRRQVRISITAEGALVLERIRELSTGHLRGLLELVSDRDLAVIEKAMRIMTAAAEQAAAR